MKNKSLNLMGLIFLFIGILVIGLGIFFAIDNNNFKKNAEKTKAVITEITSTFSDDDTPDVYVSFEVNGKTYSGELNSYSSTMYVGKEVEIYYDKNDPNKFKDSTTDFAFIIMFGLGAVFFLIGGGVLVSPILKNKKANKIKQYNFLVYATISNYTMDTSFQVNGKSPYVLYATYLNPSDGKYYEFKSEHIWRDIEVILTGQNIKQIPVYINPNNLKEYTMDLSQIMQYLG